MKHGENEEGSAKEKMAPRDYQSLDLCIFCFIKVIGFVNFCDEDVMDCVIEQIMVVNATPAFAIKENTPLNVT